MKRVLSLLYNVSQKFIAQKPSQLKADWIVESLKNLCKNYHRNQELMEIMIELLPGIKYLLY